MVNNAVGEPEQTRGTMIDDTGRQRAKTALEESGFLMNAIVNHSAGMIWAVDPETLGLVYFNQTFAEYFCVQLGVQVRQGMRPDDLSPTDELAKKWRDHYRRAMKEGPYTTEYYTATGQKILQLSFSLLKRDGALVAISVFARDVTEAKRAEDQLRESEMHFRTLAENALAGIFVIRQERLDYVNPALANMFGYEPQELVGRDPMLFVHPDDRARIAENMQRRVEGMLPNTPSEYRGVCKNGQFRDISVLGTRVSLNGSPAFIGNVVDITDRKRAELELLESEKRLSDLVEQSPVVYELYDTQGLLMRVNAAWERLWAIPRHYGVGKYNVLKSKNINDEGWRPYLERAFAGETVTLPELEYDASKEPESRGESRSRRITTLAYPIKDTAGQVRNVVVLHEDITDRWQSQEQLQRSEAKYSKLFHASPDAITLSNRNDGRFIEVNDTFCEMFGYSRAETVGHTVFELGIWDDIRVRQRLVGLVEQKIPIRNVEVNFRGKDGRLIPCDLSYETIEINGDTCLLSFIRDISDRKRSEEALRLSEETYRNLVENAGIGIVIIRGDTIAYANPQALAVIGSTRDEVVGSSVSDLVHPQDIPGVMALHARVLAGEITSGASEVRIKLPGHAEKWARIKAVPYRGDGQPATMNFLSDLTERKRGEQALQESEARFRTLVEQASEGISLVDEQGVVLEWNKAMEQISGIPRAQAINRPVWEVQWQMTRVDHRYPHKQDSFKSLFSQALRSGHLPQGGKRVEIAIQAANGVYKTLQQTTFTIKTEIGYRFGSIVLDITERTRSEAERERLFADVHAAREQLQALSRRLVQVQEEERRNIARELHDEIGQVLTGLKLMLDTSVRLPPQAASERLQEAQTLVGQLIDQVQELALDLRPTMLDDYGLLPALTWHLARFKAQTGVQVAFEPCGLEQRLPPEVETAAYRIAQEALTNVARHAAVNHATLSLTLQGEELGIQITDQGRGFEVEKVAAAGTSTGLSGMRERAIALGGRFTIAGAPGLGTQIAAFLPLNQPRQSAR